MSRSGYSDDIDGWDLIRWRGAVNSALKGKRGQALLSEMATAMDAMPAKRLIAYELISREGEVCALGAVAKHKSLNVSGIDPNCFEEIAGVFNISNALAREIAFMNDDYYDETPEIRWQRMREWVNINLLKAKPGVIIAESL